MTPVLWLMIWDKWSNHMKILEMRVRFFYNLPFFTKPYKGGETYQFIEEIGISKDFINQFSDNGLKITPLPRHRNHNSPSDLAVPSFYTAHYLEEHQPFSVHDATIPHTTIIPKERLAQIDFFEVLDLSHDLSVRWDLILGLQSAGLVTITIETTEAVPSDFAYRLGGLYLNPAYKVVDTEPLTALWMGNAERPAYIGLDELAAVLQSYFYAKANLPAVANDIFQPLDHRMQFPFITLEVETECATQAEFVRSHAKELTDFIFRPTCWEVEQASAQHVERTLDSSRVWSVAEDTLVILSYEGAIYIKIRNFDVGTPYAVSHFHLADENPVLFSFRMAVADYYLLRLIDDQLDTVLSNLKRNIHQHEKDLREFYDRTKAPSEATFYELNELIIQIINLRFKCLDLLEEVDNVDKLIDEEWHIALLDKIYRVLNIREWRDSIVGRLDNMHAWIKIIEDSYERFLDLKRSEDNAKVETRVRIAGYVFGILAVVELIGLLLDVGFSDSHPFVRFLHNTLHMDYGVSHLIAPVIVLAGMVILGIGLIRLVVMWSETHFSKTKG